MDRLTRTHRFRFTAIESTQLEAVRAAFVLFGPEISTRGRGGVGRAGGYGSGTFADLTGWASDDQGEPHSFLSSEENFRFVKALHEKNLLVPVSGDFGGPKAIRAIGAYVRKRAALVSAFYVSNVEQYLFQDGKARAFFDNAASLPVNDASVFIRPSLAAPRALGGRAALPDCRFHPRGAWRTDPDQRRRARLHSMMRPR